MRERNALAEPFESAPLVVYCDFDGTITLSDSTDVLLERLAEPEWREIEAEWEANRIGSRECMSRQVKLVRGGWSAIQNVLQDVRIDPTFPAFASWCAEQNIPLIIVSEGIDRVIDYLLKRESLVVDAVWANALEEDALGNLSLSFPTPATSSECRAGLCKCRVIGGIAGEGKRVVIGDGKSDICWSMHADWLFAKTRLLSYAEEQGRAVTPFSNFSTIQSELTSYLQRIQESHKAASRLVDSRKMRVANG